MTLWNANAFTEATGGRAVGTTPKGVTGISIDTRSLAEGEAFFAIAGDRFDGHDFARHAVDAGAAIVVIDEAHADGLQNLSGSKIVVPDVLQALENVGRAARARTNAGIAAVTGSVGKTTTKEMLRAALGNAGPTHAAVASFNNHWGVPLTLARMPTDTAFGVFEIGMNHPGEITPLVGMVRPHVAAITRIAPAHLGHFASVREIARAKAEIFSGVVDGGIAVLNRDDEHFDFLLGEATVQGVRTVRTFGTHEGSDVRLANGTRRRLTVDGVDHDLDLPLLGDHNAMNAACAVAVAVALGVAPSTAIRGIAGMDQVSGRGTLERIALKGGEITLLDESYNANPTSMRAALTVLAELVPDTGGRRIAVLGGMRELGEHSHAMHADLAEPITSASPDTVVLVGNEIVPLKERLGSGIHVRHGANVEEIEPIVLDMLRPNDLVMLKASNGTGLGRLAATLRNARQR